MLWKQHQEEGGGQDSAMVRGQTCAVAPARGCVVAPANEALGDLWGHGICFHEEQEDLCKDASEWVGDLHLGLGFGNRRGCSAKTSGEPKGGNHRGIFSFLMKKSHFALIKKPISCPSKPLSVGGGASQEPLQNMG